MADRLLTDAAAKDASDYVLGINGKEIVKTATGKFFNLMGGGKSKPGG